MSPGREGAYYVSRFAELRARCIRGQLTWTPEEKRQAFLELEGWRQQLPVSAPRVQGRSRVSRRRATLEPKHRIVELAAGFEVEKVTAKR
jgi:hypothetical protein